MAKQTTTTQNPNMWLYERVRVVPKEACKSFNNGSFSGTDINPMWRIKVLTENFGLCGIGWYYRVIEHWCETLNNEIITNVRIELFIKDTTTGEWSKPIEGIGGNKSIQQFKDKTKVSDEAYKMALTDAISVACKALGIGADIYWQNDPTKYSQYYQQPPVVPAQQPVQQMTPQQPPVQQEQYASNKTPKQVAIDELTNASSTADLKNKWAKWKPQFGSDVDVVKVVSGHKFNPKNGNN